MPRIINISGFQTCQGSQYNGKRLVLEQATLIFEIYFFKLGIPFKMKINRTLFYALVNFE